MKSPRAFVSVVGMEKLFLAAVLFLTACATLPSPAPEPTSFTSDVCRKLFVSSRKQPTEKRLDTLSELFNRGCFTEVISLGDFLRRTHRDKFYQLSGELGEVFTPEGSLTAYVMESYERTYLSLLLAVSYLNLNHRDDALVELRRAQDEGQAYIYNFGEDSVLQLLQAALWDRFDPNQARPYWKSVSLDAGQIAAVRLMAAARIQEIDLHPGVPVAWKIYGLGELPDLEWHLSAEHLRQSYFRVVPNQQFPHACADQHGVLVPTDSWLRKVGQKDQRSYHPLIFAKSLARLPVGLGYGLVGVTAGTVVGVTGCGADLYLSAAAHSQQLSGLCQTALVASGYLIQETGNLVDYTLKPDLRHWEKLPRAFYISREDFFAEGNDCLHQDQNISSKTWDLIE